MLMTGKFERQYFSFRLIYCEMCFGTFLTRAFLKEITTFAAHLKYS